MARTVGKVIENFEVTASERKRIAELAAWFGMTKAEYMRRMALGEFLDMPHFRKQKREAKA